MLCLLAGCKGSEPTEYETGLENLKKQEYTQAIENFQNAISEGGHGVQSWRGIGIAWTEQGIFDKAQEAFTTALGLTERSEKALKTDLYFYLSDALYHQGEYQKCVETCEELLKLQKKKDAYFLRGSAYLHMDEYKKAHSDFSRVVSGSGDYEDYLDVYKVYKSCDLNADGSAYLESALEIKAKSAEDFYNEGRVYYYLEEYEKAEKVLKKAWKEEYAPALVYLGKVYLDAGEPQKASDIYQKCLQQKGLEAEGYNGLAYCSVKQEDYTGALSYVEKGLKEKDKEVQQALLFNEIVIYEKQKDFATAKTKMQEYLKQYPADEEAVRENYFLQTR